MVVAGWFVVVVEGAEKGRRLTVSAGATMLLGRGDDAQLRLPEDDLRVSRTHAKIRLDGGALVVEDAGSRHGTFVNEERVDRRTLRTGDRVRVGRTVLRVEGETASAPAATEGDEDALVATYFVRAASTDDAAVPEGWACDGCQRAHPTQSAPPEQFGWLCNECSAARRRAPDATPGLVFGGFECLRLLAEGGMGRVYEARHVTNLAHAAVKVLLPDANVALKAVPRFLREQEVAWKLHHPRIVATFEVGRHASDGRLYIASEFMTGGDAAKLAARSLAIDVAVSVSADLFEALAVAHAHRIVHRDVKLENLLLGAADARRLRRAKLADFGLAKAWADSGATQLTGEERMGSMLYVAPEQLLDFKGSGPSVDVYAAGAVLYRLLTGASHLPIEPHELTMTNLVARTLDTARVPVRERRPDVPVDLAGWIDLLVAREPERRAHVGAAEVAATLLRGLGRPLGG